MFITLIETAGYIVIDIYFYKWNYSNEKFATSRYNLEYFSDPDSDSDLFIVRSRPQL